MYGYIYLTTNKANGMKYIGQHAKPEFDKYYYGSGTLLTKAFNKYGKENFDHEILAWAETKEELDQMEIELIDKYDAVESEEYYNIVPGGSGVGSGELHPNWGKSSYFNLILQEAPASIGGSTFTCTKDVSECCRGKKESYKGYKWMYKEDWYRLNKHYEQE